MHPKVRNSLCRTSVFPSEIESEIQDPPLKTRANARSMTVFPSENEVFIGAFQREEDVFSL